MPHPRNHEEAEVVVDINIRIRRRPGMYIAVPPDLRNTERLSTDLIPELIALTLSTG
jgi:hypothetical protein